MIIRCISKVSVPKRGFTLYLFEDQKVYIFFLFRFELAKNEIKYFL